MGRSGHTNIFLFRTGVGPLKAAAVSHEVLEKQAWDLVISTGYAAALTPSRIGAIVVANQVFQEWSSQESSQLDPPILCHPEFTRKAFEIGTSVNEYARLGGVVTVRRIVNRAVEKKEIAQRTGAIGLDMESVSLGQIADEKKVPFVVVRGISDLIDEDLPEELNLFLSRFGWVKGLPSVIASPKNWNHLIRLQTQMVQTSRQMTKFFTVFLRESNLWNSRNGHRSAVG